jgi:D-3-phosphoglycerate dehydrogenase
MNLWFTVTNDPKLRILITLQQVPQEPCTSSLLFGLENAIVTPHLGASTAEAQVMAASDVAEQIVDVFKGFPPKYAVNAPFIPPEMMAVLNPFLQVATRIGKLVSQLAEGQMNKLVIKASLELLRPKKEALRELKICSDIS